MQKVLFKQHEAVWGKLLYPEWASWRSREGDHLGDGSSRVSQVFDRPH
jgi:hypothetical protein